MKVLYECRRDRRAQGHDQGRDPVPGREAVDPQDRDTGVPHVLRVLQAMAYELRKRGATHVVMEASGIYTEPVYYALCEQDFTEVAVIKRGARQGAEGAQDRRQRLRAIGGAVRVRAVRVVYPADEAEGGAGPDPVPGSMPTSA
jgi:hypothetical protein